MSKKSEAGFCKGGEGLLDLVVDGLAGDCQCIGIGSVWGDGREGGRRGGGQLRASSARRKRETSSSEAGEEGGEGGEKARRAGGVEDSSSSASLIGQERLADWLGERQSASPRTESCGKESWEEGKDRKRGNLWGKGE